jgi:hypothetical protein
MIPLPRPHRTRPAARLTLRALDDRITPATAAYSAVTQTLTIVAAQADQLVVSAVPNKPTGYLNVTETQANATVFNSTGKNQSVRVLVVRFGNTNTGSLTLDATTRIGGGLVVSGGTGVTTVDVAGTVGGNIIYTANPIQGLGAIDQVTLEPTASVGGNVSLVLGDGPNLVRLRGGTIRGNLGVSATTGNDTIQVTEAGDLTVNGSVNFNLGDGNNTVLGMATHVIQVGGNFTYTGGVGNDTFDLDGSGTILDVRGDARFTLGTPLGFDSNQANFEALYARNATFIGGAGADSVEVSGALGITSNLAVSLGNGENSFTSNLLGSGANTIGGSFIYTGGANGDAVSLDNTTIGRNVNVSLGESFGSSVATFSTGMHGPGPVTVYGNMTVTTGPTTDSDVQLDRLYVGGGLTVLGGAGRNTVGMDDINVAGATLVSLGAGDNSLAIEQTPSNGGGPLGGTSTFGGTFTFNGGAGNDQVLLAVDNVSGQQIQFGSRVTLLGGGGNNSLFVGNGTTFELTGNIALGFQTIVGKVL